MTDHKPGVQQAESNGGDDDEVHCRDALLVIAKKRLPPLALIVVRASLWELPRDGFETHGDSELLKLVTQGERNERLLVRASEEGWNTVQGRSLRA